MNLIPFYVTKIISEKRDKVFKLYGMSESRLKKEQCGADKKDPWICHLLSDGLYQQYEYSDYGGKFVGEEVFNLTRGDKPYFVGYIGQH